MKKVIWSDMIGEPMMEDEEKPATGVGQIIARRITGKTTPEVALRLGKKSDLALAERVEPQQSEALMPERGQQAPRRYAAAEESCGEVSKLRNRAS